MTEEKREMVAVMFTDVRGYTSLAQKNEPLALKLLELKRILADPVIAKHHGRLIKSIGDALMVEFHSALEAVRCATVLQERLHEHNLKVLEHEQLHVRIGVHSGDVVRKGKDIFGDTVNIAARVEPHAPAGGVAITHAVYDQIRGKLDHPLIELGNFHLKGIEGEVPLFSVALPWNKGTGATTPKPGLLEGLKRHHMFRVSSVYVTMAWVLILVSNAVFPDFDLPREDVRYLIVALALAFPVVLTVSWMIIPPSRQHPDRFTRWRRLRFILGPAVSIAVTLFATLSAIFLWKLDAQRPAAEINKADSAPSIAVLRFESLSDDPENAYFSAGTQNEILTRLAQIAALKVIARTSTLTYSSHPESLKAIGKELGVTTVLEGGVQRTGDTVRVNVQLINASTDTQLWAETYDRNVKDIFAAETDIASKVAKALEVKLQPIESAGIARVPTQDPTAYDLYLRAEYLSEDALTGGAYNEAILHQSIDLYSQAIAHDPQFALAYAGRSRIESVSYWQSDGNEEALIAAAREDSQKALALAPDLPQAHRALGFVYYYGDLNYGRALSEFKRTQRDIPNDVETALAIAWVTRRQGNFSLAIKGLERASALDPRHRSAYMVTLAEDQVALGHYTDAIATLDALRTLDPSNARYLSERVSMLLTAGRLSEASAALASSPAGVIDSSPEVIFQQWRLGLYSRNPQLMLRTLAGRDKLFDYPLDAFRAIAYLMQGDKAKGEAAAARASRRLSQMDSRSPNNPDILELIAFVEASRGNAVKALSAGERAVQFDPPSKDPLGGLGRLYDLAITRARLGMVDSALDDLEQVLAYPTRGAIVSAAVLRINPFWDRARGNPRFEALLTKFENETKTQ